MAAPNDIDILENALRKKGKLLNILLIDRATGKNIIWATDSYQNLGDKYAPAKQILPDLVTGENGELIQPRAAKSREEQRRRTKDKGEVFTPIEIVAKMNNAVDKACKISAANPNDWQRYVREPILEITCGEAPFMVTRYNSAVHARKVQDIDKREGFLDRKLQVVTEYCSTPKKWLYWAKQAFKASYGYEWQGDNILIARENLLYTLIDNYKKLFGNPPSLSVQYNFAEIISWNIFQMDGLKYVIPMSCKKEKHIILGERTLLEETPDIEELRDCKGCLYNQPDKHTGKYAKVMDWEAKKPIRFVDLVINNS